MDGYSFGACDEGGGYFGFGYRDHQVAQYFVDDEDGTVEGRGRGVFLMGQGVFRIDKIRARSTPSLRFGEVGSVTVGVQLYIAGMIAD